MGISSSKICLTSGQITNLLIWRSFKTGSHSKVEKILMKWSLKISRVKSVNFYQEISRFSKKSLHSLISTGYCYLKTESNKLCNKWYEKIISLVLSYRTECTKSSCDTGVMREQLVYPKKYGNSNHQSYSAWANPIRFSVSSLCL